MEILQGEEGGKMKKSFERFYHNKNVEFLHKQGPLVFSNIFNIFNSHSPNNKPFMGMLQGKKMKISFVGFYHNKNMEFLHKQGTSNGFLKCIQFLQATFTH